MIIYDTCNSVFMGIESNKCDDKEECYGYSKRRSDFCYRV